MACGGCGKKKIQVINTNVNTGAASSKRHLSAKTGRVSATKTKSDIQSIASTATPAKCPVCSTPLMKVTRVGVGDLLQCANPRCGYVRKNK